MKFLSCTSSDDIVERTFDLDGIPGVLWTPPIGSEGAPLILIGHPGGQHKLAPGPVARARHYVTRYGFNAAAIDAPGHGDRRRSAEDQRWVDAMVTPDEEIRRLPHETLIVHGREDRVIPLANSLRLLELIPAAQLHVFGHCGHWTQIERADAFGDLLAGFLTASPSDHRETQ